MRDRPAILAALALLIVILTAPFWYGAWAHTGRVPLALPPAKGAHCIRPTEWMLKNHMKLLMRERYEVVHEGIRNKSESLPACIGCHVSKLADGTYPSATSPQFFCNACHQQVGVRIDCFSCHTNLPQSAGATVAQADGESFRAARAAIRDVPWRDTSVSSVVPAAAAASGRWP